MRIPFPERVPLERVALFAIALFIVQWVEGTAFYFRFGCAVFILIAALAFNTAGGLTRASGVYVFFNSLMVVIIGVCYKAFLGEPGQSNLLDPKTDIEVYVAGISAMFAAILISSRFRRKSGLLQNLLKESAMYRASIGCMVFGVFGGLIISLLGEGAFRLATAFTQLNQLIPLGMIIGVMYEIRRSGGRRSINTPIVIAGVYNFVFYGILGFSKQGMLLPAVCWLFPVCALRFRLSALQVFSCAVGAFIMFFYLSPYAQYARRFNYEITTNEQRVALAVKLLSHPDETRRTYNAEFEGAGGLSAYYSTPQGFWERLQFISVDDRLIEVTDEGHVFGFIPIKAELLNAIPHVFWPDKPIINFGNVYAHEIGALAPDDTDTGVSFSPSAEAYHMGRWAGILFAGPIMWFLLFVTYDSLFGDLRLTPWGVLVIALFAHSAPESSLSGLIYFLTFGVEALVFCAVFATWAAPIIATLVVGPDRRPLPGPPQTPLGVRQTQQS